MATVYSIILDDDMPRPLAEEVLQRVEQEFTDRYRVAENVIIVLSDEQIDEVIGRAGIGAGPAEGPAETPAGVVFSLNGQYGGYFKTDFWEWIKALREKGLHEYA